MLEWKVMTGEEKCKQCKRDMANRFDKWFAEFWGHKCSREIMLSPESPLPHVYALMCLPVEEVKKIYPSSYYEECSDCGESVDVWLETDFSFCDEYGCGLKLCHTCAQKLKKKIENFEQVVSNG